MNVEDTVRELADTEAIRNLARRYAHFVWQRDASGVVSLFAENGVYFCNDKEEGGPRIAATWIRALPAGAPEARERGL